MTICRHTHVTKAGGQVVINLGDENTRVSVRENKGMPLRDERKAEVIAGQHQEYLLQCWEDIHG